MNRLIKVGTLNGANVYVNPIHVQSVSKVSDGDVTIILSRGQVFTYVIETPDHVASAINNA